MPAILTHDLFGADSLGDVCSLLGFTTFDEHDAFMLGNQGPDPLFYLLADPFSDKTSQDLGECMHHEHPASLLVALHDATSMLPEEERQVGEAYAAGFLCHYLLDSAMHPFIYFWEYGLCDVGVKDLDRSCGSLVHAEIERDLDEMALYTRTGSTVRDFVPWRCVLEGSDATLDTIDRIYFYLGLWAYNRTLPMDLYTKALKSFRRVQHLFWSPDGGKIKVFGALERFTKRSDYSFYAAMSHRVRAQDSSVFDNREHQSWEDPFTGAASNESFWDLYNKARKRVPEAEEAFFAQNFDLAASKQLTGELNFNGEPTAGRVKVEVRVAEIA
jgi:hypothetical protein